jgi:integrase
MRRLGFLAGLLPAPTPLPTIKVDNVRKGFFSNEEAVRVLRHLPVWYAPAIEFAWTTGWRIGEVKGLMWARVDFKDGVVRLEPGTTKNRQGRMFPFSAHPQLNALLLAQHERTREWQREHGQVVPWVFWKDGRQLGDHRDTWTRACREAGLPGRLVHDLRRTAVRNLERAGIPRSTAMRITGHLTESVYRRYAISSDADMVEAVRKLAAAQPATRPAEERDLPAAATQPSTEQAQF